MSRRARIVAVAALAMAAAGGCAPRDAGFSDVRKTVRDRSGQETEWTRRREDDQRAAEATKKLVANELTLESALRIALLNNRHLQATFERLGIARGRFIQAAVPDNPVFSMDLRLPPDGVSFEGAFYQDFISLALIPLRRDVTGNELTATKAIVTREAVHLIGDVKRAYHTYQAAKQLVDMLDHAVQATKASYLFRLRMREAGNTRQLDVFRERALYEETKVQHNAAVESLATAREALNALLGLWGANTGYRTAARLADVPARPLVSVPSAEPRPPAPGAPAVTPAESPPKMPGPGGGPSPDGEVERAERLAGPPDREDVAARPGPRNEADDEAERIGGESAPSARRFAVVEKTTVARSLELAALRSLIEAQAARVKLETIREIFPFLNAGVSAELSPESKKWGFGPAARVPIPLWDFAQGTNPAEVSVLKQRVEEYAALATDVRAAARAHEARLQTTRSRATYYRDVIMPLHAAVVAEEQLQYNAMQTTPFELLLMKQRQIQAATQYIAALLDYWIARSELEELLDGSLPTGGLAHTIGVLGGGFAPTPSRSIPMPNQGGSFR